MNQQSLANTALVLELPFPVQQKMQQLRERFDPVLAKNIPGEITIAGSSGLGTIAAGQNSELVLGELNQIARETKAFTARFGPVRRFPDSTVYVFLPEPETPFQRLHQLLKQSLISFAPSKYPFQPHCSLHIWGKLTSEQETEILQAKLTEIFTLTNLALYQQVSEQAVALIERFYFSP